MGQRFAVDVGFRVWLMTISWQIFLPCDIYPHIHTLYYDYD